MLARHSMWDIFLSLTIIGLIFGALPSSAHAYLDPGTGSMAIQLIVAGVVGAMFTLKMYWRRTRDYLFGFFKKSNSTQSDA